jgi:D-tyrosyl-tRNA(Tyr) deacylase
MRVLIQRVKSAFVTLENGEVCGKIDQGLLLFLGITTDDVEEDVSYLVHKILQLRIFDDDEGVMNLSIEQVSGEMLIVSQFTLHASTKKGNRPSYIRAARPEKAIPLYETFISKMKESKLNVQTGKFGAMMAVSLINNGPVTLWIDSKNKEY